MKKLNGTDLKYSDHSGEASLWQYKKVVLTNDVRYLLSLKDYDGLPEIDDLKPLHEAWMTISEEFSGITSGSRHALWLNKHKQLMIARHRLGVESAILRMLQKFPHPDLIEMANEFGYKISIDDLDKTFEKAYTRLMKLKNSTEEKERRMNRESDKPDIDGMIIMLEKYQGYQFNEKEMPLSKFAHVYKNYIKENG